VLLGCRDVQHDRRLDIQNDDLVHQEEERVYHEQQEVEHHSYRGPYDMHVLKMYGVHIAPKVWCG